MPNLMAGAALISATLAGAGIRATMALQSLNPPAVLIGAPIIRPRFGGCWECEWTLYALVGNSGPAESLTAAGDLLAATMAALDTVGPAEPVEIADTQGGRLPGYKLTFTSEIV